MSSEALVNQAVGEAMQDENAMHEALVLARMREWETDLYRFSLECLGNNPQTDKKLEGNLEPRVAAYTRWVGDRILSWLAARAAGKVQSRRKIMVLVPRECFKTTNLTTTIPVWMQILDPNCSVVIDAAKMQNMADKMLDVVKEHMTGARPSSQLIDTYGEFRHPKRTWNYNAVTSAKRTDTARKDKTVEITSVDVGATGSHPDLWIWDDPVTRELANETHFKNCWNHYLGIFPIVRKDGLLMLIATRYSDSDPSGRIIEEEIAPAAVAKYGQLPDDFRRNWDKYAHLAGWDVWLDRGRNPDNPSEAWYPLIWPIERMEEYERIAPAEFAAQVQNMPGERKDLPLQREHIDRLWIDFGDVPDAVWNNVYLHMDLAWKDAKAYVEATGDYSVIQVWGRDNSGRAYFLPLGYRGRDMQEQFRDHFVTIMQQISRRRGRVKLITYDKPQAGMGTAISEWFRDVCAQEGFRCPPLMEMNRRAQLQKDERCMMASRYWIDGTVQLVKHAPHVNVLVDEMLGIGATRYDDMRDAAADHFHSDVWRGGVSARRTQGFQPGHRKNSWEDYFSASRSQDNSIVLGDPGISPLERDAATNAARSYFSGR